MLWIILTILCEPVSVHTCTLIVKGLGNIHQVGYNVVLLWSWLEDGEFEEEELHLSLKGALLLL